MIKRYLAIDYGTVRTGIAISDPLGILASGLTTLATKHKSLAEVADMIAVLVREHQITDILLGLPKRTDGKVGDKEVLVRELEKELLRATGIVPILFDERYTTVIAQRIMRENNVKTHKRKAIVDQIAAEILLQDYLDAQRK